MITPDKLIKLKIAMQEVLEDGEFVLYIDRNVGACTIVSKETEKRALERNITVEEIAQEIGLATGILQVHVRQLAALLAQKHQAGIYTPDGKLI